MFNKYDPIREILTTIVAEAMYQDILSVSPNLEDTPAMRAVFALMFPDLLAGDAEGLVRTMREILPGANPPSAEVDLSVLSSGGLTPLSGLDELERLLGSIPGGIDDLQVTVLSPDTLGGAPFIGEKGDMIPKELPPEIHSLLKSLGLIEGEVLKDNMPADFSGVIQVRDDSLN